MSEKTNADWVKDVHYAPVIRTMQQSMPEDLRALVDSTDCFGMFNVPAEGDCPEHFLCTLSTYCRQTWQLTQIRGAESAVPVPVVPDGLSVENAAAAQQRVRTSVDPRIDGARYQRSAYEASGRLVDLLLAAFLEPLVDLPRLPVDWHQAHLDKYMAEFGKYMISGGPSFHTVRCADVVLARFWTNNVRWALVDIIADFSQALHKASAELGSFSYGPPSRKKDILQLEPPFVPPESVWTKIRPCTQRVTVRTQAAAITVGQVVRKYCRA